MPVCFTVAAVIKFGGHKYRLFTYRSNCHIPLSPVWVILFSIWKRWNEFWKDWRYFIGNSKRTWIHKRLLRCNFWFLIQTVNTICFFHEWSHCIKNVDQTKIHRTDFYCEITSPNDKIGFPPGVNEQIVLKVYCLWKPGLSYIFRQNLFHLDTAKVEEQCHQSRQRNSGCLWKGNYINRWYIQRSWWNYINRWYIQQSWW